MRTLRRWWACRAAVVIGCLLGVSLLGALPLGSAAHAQDALPVAVFDTATADHGATLGLDVFFVLRDAGGRPVPSAQIERADLRLLDDPNAVAVFQSAGEADSPIYIALLLDTSGSMEGALPGVLAAARAVIDQAPSNARIAVTRFSDQAQRVLGYSDDRGAVRAALDQIANPQGNTCMYDTLYTALEDLSATAGAVAGGGQARKAIILFTDGQDIRLVQNGPNVRCSTRTYDEVVARALDYQVPINTIGMYSQPDDINRQELVQLAQDTSAFSAIGAGGNVADLFATIFTGLNSQYRASFELNIAAGPQRALLEVQLQNDAEALFSAPFRFVVPRDFLAAETPAPTLVPTPLPAAEAAINGIVFNAETGFYDVVIGIGNPQAIDQLIVTVEGDNGLIAANDPYSLQGKDILEARIDSRLLEEGREYTILIRGNDAAGKCVPRPPDPNRFDEAPDCVLAQKQFTHERPKPPPVEAVIQPVVAQAASKELVIPLKITRADAVDRFSGTIADAETNQEIARFGPDIYEPGKPLTVPMPPAMLTGQAAGANGNPRRFLVSVVLQTTDGQEVGTEPYSFVVEYPPPVPWHEQLFGALEENPLILGGIALVVLLLSLYLILNSRKKKDAFRIPDDGYTVVAGGGAAAAEHREAALAIKIGQTPLPSDRRSYEINDFPCTIGRSSNCDIRVAGDRQISRQHASIVRQDGEFMVKDLGSDNGTWLDGKRLTPNQATKLRDAQTLKLGDSTTLDVRIKY